MIERELKKYRFEVYWHYLYSVFRYDPRFLTRNFVGAMKRRLGSDAGKPHIGENKQVRS